ncbi:hypothetical protein [Mycoplasma sp. 1012]
MTYKELYKWLWDWTVDGINAINTYKLGGRTIELEKGWESKGLDYLWEELVTKKIKKMKLLSFKIKKTFSMILLRKLFHLVKKWSEF